VSGVKPDKKRQSNKQKAEIEGGNGNGKGQNRRISLRIYCSGRKLVGDFFSSSENIQSFA